MTDPVMRWKAARPSVVSAGGIVLTQVLPFWGFTIAGLVLSTLAVSAVSAVTASTVAVGAANVGAFGLLWIAKFVVLDGVVFAPVGDDGAPASAVPVGIA